MAKEVHIPMMDLDDTTEIDINADDHVSTFCSALCDEVVKRFVVYRSTNLMARQLTTYLSALLIE